MINKKEGLGPNKNLHVLTEKEMGHYEEEGYHPKVALFPSEKASEYLSKLECFEKDIGILFSKRNNLLKYKAHLLFAWVDELIRTPSLLDAVEDALGTPNIMVRATDIFVKEPKDPSFISFHQDATYWGLDTTKVLTAWVALTDSNVENGVMHVIPGTQNNKQMPHVSKPNENNMLTNYQEVESGFDETKAVPLELSAGEASLHNFLIVHGSYPNNSLGRRAGIAIRYMAADVDLSHDKPDYATLVRGKDTSGRFILEKAPRRDIDPLSISLMNQYQKVMSATAEINFESTTKKEPEPA